jgi:hypothetical protein
MSSPINNLIVHIPTGQLVSRTPFIRTEDGNNNLPTWFFDEENFTHFEEYADYYEWTPVMGPAPCWKSRPKYTYPEFKNVWAEFVQWHKETY